MITFVLAVLFIIFGGWMFINPKGALDFKVAMGKKAGIKMTPSKKTYKVYKWLGLALLAIGAFILF